MQHNVWKRLTGLTISLQSPLNHLPRKLVLSFLMTGMLQPSHHWITSVSSWSLASLQTWLDTQTAMSSGKRHREQPRDDLDSYVDARWKEVDESEMRAFLGPQVFMSSSELPRYELYWSKNPFVGNEGFKTTMTRNRYEKLQEYFHVSGRRSEPARNAPDWSHCIKFGQCWTTSAAFSRRATTPTKQFYRWGHDRIRRASEPQAIFVCKSQSSELLRCGWDTMQKLNVCVNWTYVLGKKFPNHPRMDLDMM